MNLAASLLVNMTRRLENMFPGMFQSTPKHDHRTDFGWPKTIDFNAFYQAYSRNGIAAAAVDKTIRKTWQEKPELWETDKPEETLKESDIVKHFRKIRFWQMLAEADRMSMVGGYAGVIFRLADSKAFNQPVDRVPGGIEGLVEVIPVWAGQLRVSNWDTDQTSASYGKPTLYQFNESSVRANTADASTNKTRSFDVHPDRVFIWSEDGTVHCPSSLEPGYNDLIDLEKVKGAGGEGFWKNAKSAPVLQIDSDAKLEDMARSMGVTVEEIADKMNDQVTDFQRGFDQVLMMQGMEAKTLAVTLPSPEHFWNVPLQSFAASFGIPLKILVGSQTGERASTEDSKEWSETCNSRRQNHVIPSIEGIAERLTDFGILADRDWTVHWPDLTESTTEEKLNRAEKMANINSKNPDAPVFLPEEIREVVDMKPLPDSVYEDDEEDKLEGETEPTPGNEDPEEEV